MRDPAEFDAILIYGTMQGGCRMLNLWKIYDRCCHGGRRNLPTRRTP